MKIAISNRLYICRSWTIVKRSSTKSMHRSFINLSFIFLSVRVNVALLLPQIFISPFLQSPSPLALELATIITFPYPDITWVKVGHIFITNTHRRWKVKSVKTGRSDLVNWRFRFFLFKKPCRQALACWPHRSVDETRCQQQHHGQLAAMVLDSWHIPTV
jgi:hypothetical protein